MSTVDLAQFPFEVVMKLVDLGFTVISLYAFWYSVMEFGIVVPGWSQPEIIVMTGVGLIGSALTQLGFGFRDISYRIIDGTLDTYLIRPVHPLFTILAERLSVFWVGTQSVAGTALILMGAKAGGLSTTDLLPAATTLVLGCMTYEAIFGCISLSSLWFGRVSSIRDVLFSLTSSKKYPTDVLPRTMGRVLTWILPLGLVATLPTKILLGKVAQPWTVVGWASLLAAFWALILLIVWNKGLTGYQSTGS